ncbi:MAG TPA: crossover junction endodeoxyribonuclease RuvC [Candidatus Peribacterales bacterium]|nr:crossover junction endodeoxyribonuclease RuvC [Candidatus Peribacterales bacterium]
MIILGIDPGLATVGIGIIEYDAKRTFRVIDYCTIETLKASLTAERLRVIAVDLLNIIREHHPTIAVIEKLYFETNQKTAMVVSEARGVILLTCAKEELTIVEPSPLELKLAVTGDGRADKKQMEMMLSRTLNIDLSGVPDDAVDALGLALFGAVTREKIIA